MADAAHLDRLYRGFQPLQDWLGLPVDFSLWDDARATLAGAREAAAPETFDALLQEVLRQAAIDTGAIEQLYATDRGFTITVAGMAATWEAEIAAQKGEDVARMVVGHKHGYDLALDVATHTAPMTEALIRQMHEEVCAGQDTYDVRTPAGPQRHPLPKGEYKKHPNHVELADGAVHAYAPVDAVPDEMHALIEVLRSDEFEQAQPVVQAAWAHHAFVAIHPFADGNGRVARVLASVYLLRAASIPLVVFADQRPGYLDALAGADAGQPELFVSLVRDRSVDTVLLLTERLRGSLRSTTDPLQRIRGAPAPEEVDLAARRLQELLFSELRTRVVSLGDEVSTILVPTVHRAPPQTRLSRTPGPPAVALTVDVNRTSVSETLVAMIALDPSRPLPVGVWASRIDDILWFRPTDLVPDTSTAARLRLEAWVDRVVNDLLTHLADKLDKT